MAQSVLAQLDAMNAKVSSLEAQVEAMRALKETGEQNHLEQDSEKPSASPEEGEVSSLDEKPAEN
jgi:hypothetical protein